MLLKPSRNSNSEYSKLDHLKRFQYWPKFLVFYPQLVYYVYLHRDMKQILFAKQDPTCWSFEMNTGKVRKPTKM